MIKAVAAMPRLLLCMEEVDMGKLALPAGLDPSRDYVLLVDLSHYEPDTDFHALADAGVSGVITKCTDGLNYVDPTYDVFRKKAEIVAAERGGNFFFGGYHFFRPNLDPFTQARYFLDHAKPVKGDVLPTLDSETDGQLVGDRSKDFANAVCRRTGRFPILYTGDAFYKEKLKKSFGSGVCPLWIARYGHKPETPCAIWQWTDRAVVAGEPKAMDADVFFGSVSDFRAKMTLK